MSGTDRTLVVGGGIGGLAVARALSLTGRRSLVIEQAPAFAEIGAGIQLAPNAFKVLDALGLREAVEPLLVYPEALVAMNGVTAEEITRIPVGRDQFRQRFGQPYALVHRADLHRALLDACAGDPKIELRSGTTVSSFTEERDGVVATTSIGETLEGGKLIGADGLWSNTRAAIIGDGPPRASGHIAYRAVLPIEEVEERFRQNAMILWAGPRNHLVQYPLRGGKLFNLVAVFHSDRYVEGWDREGDPDELRRRFEGNCSIVRTLLSKVDAWRMWVLCDREPTKGWSKGKATLLGDAAHPMLQYLAQGAAMALEDAMVLARNLVTAGGNDAAALRNYVQERYLRTGHVQVMARVYGEFFHAEGVTQELATSFLQARSVEDSFESFAWLYDYDAAAAFPFSA